MNKIRCVFSQIYYPMALGKYFVSALKSRDDIELIQVGPYTGTWIPWKGGMHIDLKYCVPPDIALPRSLIGNVGVNPSIVESQLPWDEVDLWINCDAGFCFTRPQSARNVVTICTDPHVLDYDFQRTQADLTFCMQAVYMKDKDRYLPYAACREFHYPEELEKVYDVCLIGLQYENRTQLVNQLRAKGLKVYYDTGAVFDEYRKIYNQSKVAISWSSRQDLIARVFEAMAMKIPLVCNRVPDLPTHFVEHEHYYGFDTLDEAVAQVMMTLNNYDDALDVADAAYNKVMAQHLYDYRIADILKTVKLK